MPDTPPADSPHESKPWPRKEAGVEEPHADAGSGTKVVEGPRVPTADQDPEVLDATGLIEPHSPDRPGALIEYNGKALELKIIPAAEGAPGIEISKLLTTIGVITLDPGFTNTGSTTSAVTYIDGDAGILRYRGYPIEQLAQSSTFIETSFLLIHGELPSPAQLDAFTQRISRRTMLHEDLKHFFDGFPRDAHPMPVLSSAVSALSTFFRMRSIRSTLSRWSCPPCGCWPSCRRSPRTPTRSPSGSRCCTRTTPSGWSRTSCGCPLGSRRVS